jgi:arginyl-tRNA synthetase
MNIIDMLQQELFTTIKKIYPEANNTTDNIVFSLNTDSAKQSFGDISTNAAMVIGKEVKLSPREVGSTLIKNFKHGYIRDLQIAGPGFINIFLTNEAYILLLEQMIKQQDLFFVPTLNHKEKISVEFVSANPTGPLHIGHGRNGIIGDVLANVLRFAGHAVTKEFYINDAGNQIQKLGACFKIRCQQLLGQTAEIPEEGYQGEYLIELARQAIDEHGPKILENNEAFFAHYAKEKMLEAIKKTLSDYGISFDVWFSEKTLHTDGSVEKALTQLTDSGYTYQQENALWFKSTTFGDDKDRVLRKSSGEVTYAAADAAYLINKINRGFNHLFLVIGQDHHSYKNRLLGILQATGNTNISLDVILYQLVSLKQNGQELRLSKRAGRIVSLEDIIQLVGRDVARFFFLNRKADSHLDFDIDLALKKTEENPVYYIQYAYVRIKSILEKAKEHEALSHVASKDATAISPEEYLLLKKILELRDIIFAITKNHQTHLLTYYILELAQLFHKYYGKTRIIDANDPNLSRARLLLLTQLQKTFEVVLSLLVISRPEKM